MMSLAKALSSAYMPVSAAVVSGEMYQAMVQPSAAVGVFGHGYTYSGHPVACAVASKVLEIYARDNIFDQARVLGDYLQSRLGELADQWHMGAPVYFEPFAHEALRAAHKTVLGVDVLPTYRLEAADLLLCFGADFLETWLSPVEYARRFKEMHAIHEGHKGVFFHLSPYLSLTAANADRWQRLRPGSEPLVILALIGHCLEAGRGADLPRKVRRRLTETVAVTNLDKAAASAGIPPAALKRLADRLVAAQRPLILGGGSGTAGPASDATELAALLLNLVLDPNLGRIDFDQPQNLASASPRPAVNALVEDIIDTGHTLKYLLRTLAVRKPANLSLAALLIKDDVERPHFDIQYEGFHIPNEFVVGYGLDFDEKYRNLPYIGVMDTDSTTSATDVQEGFKLAGGR